MFRILFFFHLHFKNTSEHFPSGLFIYLVHWKTSVVAVVLCVWNIFYLARMQFAVSLPHNLNFISVHLMQNSANKRNAASEANQFARSYFVFSFCGRKKNPWNVKNIKFQTREKNHTRSPFFVHRSKIASEVMWTVLYGNFITQHFCFKLFLVRNFCVVSKLIWTQLLGNTL